MSRPSPLDRQLAELFGKYVRAVDGVERQQLGAAMDAAYARYLAARKEQPHAQQPADRLSP